MQIKLNKPWLISNWVDSIDIPSVLLSQTDYSNEGMWFHLFFHQLSRKIEEYSCNGFKYLYRLFIKNIFK